MILPLDSRDGLAVGLTEATLEIQEAVNSGEIRPQTGYEQSRITDPVERARLVVEAKAGRLRRDNLKGRSKKKAKVATSRTFKFGGVKITAERSKGIDLIGLIEALRLLADQAWGGPKDHSLELSPYQWVVSVVQSCAAQS